MVLASTNRLEFVVQILCTSNLRAGHPERVSDARQSHDSIIATKQNPPEERLQARGRVVEAEVATVMSRVPAAPN